MTRTLTQLPKSQIQIEITLPFPEFEAHVKRAAQALSEERDIEGFRRGKAPYDVVKQQCGEAAIYERAAEHAVRKTYPALIEELEDHPPEGKKQFLPVGSPEITVMKLAPGNEFIYKAVLAIMPEVVLSDYVAIAKKITASEKKEITVSDEEIEKTLEWIRESRMQTTPVERVAEKNDLVEIDFTLRHNNVKWEGGESRNHPLVIGKQSFIPGFEEHLVGMKAGDEKDFSLAIPENWRDHALAGKTIDAHVKMNIVKERILPELTQEFIKQLGAFDSLAMLKKSISDGIYQEKQEKEKQRVRTLIIEAIAQKIETEIPDVLREREIEKMLEELKNGIEQMGMKWEDYLLHIKKTIEQLHDEWHDEAHKRVKIALSLHEIAHKEHIEPNAEEIEKKSNEFLRQFKTADMAQKQIDPDRLREYARGILKNEKVFEFLEAQ